MIVELIVISLNSIQVEVGESGLAILGDESLAAEGLQN
jgi:hypothetical protein